METKKTAKKTARKRGAPKGTMPPNAGKGRPKGSKNLVTKNIKAALEQALACDGKDGVPGEVVFFKKMKEDEPVAFLNVVARLLPLQVDIDATIDTHITFKLVE